MNVTLTGATGLIGGSLIHQLLAAGHSVHALARKRPAELPAAVRFSEWNATQGEPPPESLAGAEAVIHLAGEPVAQRWTPEIKRRIRASRVDGTRHLVNALSTQSHRPRVLVSGSAIGFYGSQGDEVLTEASTSGGDFLADVSRQWEHAALLAGALGIRVVLLRIGIVLSEQGGALARMLPPFRWGAGGRLGNGRQWMSWIHMDDLTSLILFSMENGTARGPVNATSPNPVTNRVFTRELAKALHRPAIFPVPRWAVRMMFGELADAILASQRVVPAVAQAAGFRFQYPELPAALSRVLKDERPSPNGTAGRKIE